MLFYSLVLTFSPAPSQKYLLWMNNPEVKKKSPPKLQIRAATSVRPGLSAVCLKTKVPLKYISPPIPAKKSTLTPLESSLQASLKLLPACPKTFLSFQVWATTIKAEPTMKRSIPHSNSPISGMKHADPIKQSNEPMTLTKKLMARSKNLQSLQTQLSHQVISASRKVVEPIVQSHPEISAASTQSLQAGKSRIDPTRKVPPPMKQLRLCQIFHELLLLAVDYGSISKIFLERIQSKEGKEGQQGPFEH